MNELLVKLRGDGKPCEECQSGEAHVHLTPEHVKEIMKPENLEKAEES